MMNLYTSIGRYELRGDNSNTYPVVIVNEKEFALTTHEMILWSSLLWNIHTYDEARTIFYKKEREAHILDDEDFEYYLKRLIFRGLIVSGNEITGIDALYDMIANLHPILAGNVISKIIAFLHLTIEKRIPIKHAKSIFKCEKLTKLEKDTLKLIKHAAYSNLSVAELIKRLDTKEEKLDLNKIIGIDDDNAKNYSRFQSLKTPIVSAISNLYLKKLIIFDSL